MSTTVQELKEDLRVAQANGNNDEAEKIKEQLDKLIVNG